jgi:hypothetical protein
MAREISGVELRLRSITVRLRPAPLLRHADGVNKAVSEMGIDEFQE